jgi:hypothetical protein
MEHSNTDGVINDVISIVILLIIKLFYVQSTNL